MDHTLGDADAFDGNGILYSGMYFQILKRLNAIDLRRDSLHLAKIYTICELEPGLITRGKDNLSPQKQDDYIGILLGAQQLDFYIANDIYMYGIANGWTYNNMGLKGIKNKLNLWFGRFPGFIPHVKICAGRKLNFFDQLSWAVAIAYNAISGDRDASGIQLKWCMVQAYKNTQENEPYALLNWAAKIWDKHLKIKYQSGYMGEVFEKYFYKDHPFVAAMWGIV